ncbi:MAG: shikimate kinase, partial [Deltaproteobacteria bacterium]|nr:shikimate kinase [Deltaproteobacteria bacterium]
LDDLIEKEAGMQVKDIFKTYGEPHFRQMEKDIIMKLHGGAYGTGIILSTGGGAVVDSANREILKSFGKVICLKASVDEILHRVGGRGDRPLLSAPDKREAAGRLLKSREEAYRDCDFTIDTTSLSIEDVLAAIKGYIKNFN